MVFMFSADRKRVVMTGFSPFTYDESNNPIKNPSWEGVKSINARAIENKHDLTLFRKEIGVIYKEVDTIVPQMWHYYQPHLTIHVGLHPTFETFVLEKKANKNGYKNADIVQDHPENHCNAFPGPNVVSTTLDVDRICTEFNNCKRKLPDPKLRAEPSEKAGKYLCEYIYYTSLAVGRSPTLFVHVPVTLYTYEQIAQGLERILELCLEQLPKDELCDNNYSINFAEQTETINMNVLSSKKTSFTKMIKNYFSKKHSINFSNSTTASSKAQRNP